MSKFSSAGGAAMTSNRDDWETPRELFERLDAVYRFTLDPCSTHANAKTPKHYTIMEDGLAQSWAGETVFCNPPYGRQIGAWVEKAAKEAAGGATVVMLIPARTDTRYFHQFIYHRARVEFLPGRIRFEIDGEPQGQAPFPSMLVYFNEGVEE